MVLTPITQTLVRAHILRMTLLLSPSAALLPPDRIERSIPRHPLTVVRPNNKLFTSHGGVMVLFFLMPSIPSPRLWGIFWCSDDRRAGCCRFLSFPRNLATGISSLRRSGRSAIVSAAIDTGCTVYTPYSITLQRSRLAMVGRAFLAVQFLARLHFTSPFLNGERQPHVVSGCPAFLWSRYGPHKSSGCWPRPCWRSPWCLWGVTGAWHGHFLTRARAASRVFPAVFVFVNSHPRSHHDSSGLASSAK